jgi:hypothetical protein
MEKVVHAIGEKQARYRQMFGASWVFVCGGKKNVTKYYRISYIGV